MSGIDETLERRLHREALEDERQQLLLEVARLEGEVTALRDQMAALEAAEEHHRAEVEAAQLEAADARAAQRADQVRVEASHRLVAELRTRVEQADEARVRAENERAAVIAALGRKARRLLEG